MVFPYFLCAWATVIVSVRELAPIHYSLVPTMRNVLLEPFDLLFIFGGLLFYLAKRVGSQPMPTRLAEGGAGLVMLVVACLQTGTFVRCILLGAAFALVMLSTLPWTATPGNRLQAVLCQLGDYSYGIYLAQVPVVTIIYAVAITQYHARLSSLLAVMAFVSAMIFGILMGKLDMHLHGKSREWARRWERRHPASSSTEIPPTPATTQGIV